jgi:hypothetical protein
MPSVILAKVGLEARALETGVLLKSTNAHNKKLKILASSFGSAGLG